MKNLFVILLSALILFSPSAFAETAKAERLSCTIGSRQFEIDPLQRDIYVELHKRHEVKTYTLEPWYEVTLVQVGVGMQGQLTVKNLKKDEYLYQVSWQQLSLLNGIDIVGGHGFTGLILIGGGVHDSFNTVRPLSQGNIELPELQMTCRVN